MQRNLPAALDEAEDQEDTSQGVDAFHGCNLLHRMAHTITESNSLKCILDQKAGDIKFYSLFFLSKERSC